MTDIETVRLLIPDLDAANYAFSDDQIERFLVLASNKVFLAAALALEVVATDEALVYKIVRTDDLTVNGVTGAVQVLLVRAKQLRSDQVKVDTETSPEEGFILTFPEHRQVCRPEASAGPWPF